MCYLVSFDFHCYNVHFHKYTNSTNKITHYFKNKKQFGRKNHQLPPNFTQNGEVSKPVSFTSEI